MSLKEVVSDFLDERGDRNLSKDTITMYRQALGNLEKSLGGSTAIGSITIDDLRLHMRRESGKGYASKTLHTYRQCVKTFFNYLVEEGILDRDPSVRLAEVKVEQRLVSPLSLKEAQALIDHFDTSTVRGLRNQLLVLLMLDTGGRVSEVAGIRIADIDLDGLRIRIMGKGGKERYLNISVSVRRLLRRYLQTTKSEGGEDRRYLFQGSNGKPITRDAVRRIVREAGKAVGIENVHPHRFRHTFTSEYVSNGGDAFSLQRELGHSNIQMSNHYVSIYDKDIQRKHQDLSPVSKLTIRSSRRKDRTAA